MVHKSKIFSALGLICLLFVLWEICAYIVGLSFVIPHPIPTIKTLLRLLFNSQSIAQDLNFWRIVGLTLSRIFIGLFFGIVLGIFLAILAIKVPILQGAIQTLVGIIKATPVASFILVLWVVIGKDTVPVAIAILMVAPLIYQNLFTGYYDLERNAREVLEVFRVPFLTRLKIFILPELLKYLFPAVISATGLAWKSGIAAEIIAFTKDSIGREISNAKNYLEGELLFAWTLVVILLSLIFEYGLKFLERKVLSYDRTHGRIEKF